MAISTDLLNLLGLTLQGCVVGGLIFLVSKGKNSRILRFDEQLFFIYVLPPIIFNAGFKVKKKQFFHNFLTIMSFGVSGVFIIVAGNGVHAAFHDPGSIDPETGSGSQAGRRGSRPGHDPIRWLLTPKE